MSAHNLLEELLEAPQDVRQTGDGDAIILDKSPAYVEITTAAAETRTLANPQYVGQVVRLCMNEDGGDCVVTVASAFNASGHTAITLAAVGDWIELVAMRISGVLAWRETGKSGATTA